LISTKKDANMTWHLPTVTHGEYQERRRGKENKSDWDAQRRQIVFGRKGVTLRTTSEKWPLTPRHERSKSEGKPIGKT